MRARITRSRLDTRGEFVFLETMLAAAAKRGQLRQLLEGFFLRRHRSEIAQRLHVAQLLRAGYSYRGIEDATRTSSRTIAAVDRWLRRDNPHYRRLLPLRHTRRYRRTGRFTDAEPTLLPFNTRGILNTLFGPDIRQR